MVYEAAATRGITPPVADECEMWVLAAALGGNRADETADPLVDASGLDWNARRTTALEMGLPEPKWEEVPLTAKEIADQKRMMAMFPPLGPTTLPDPAG